MYLLEPKTAELLSNIEKLIPTPPKEGYYPKTYMISEYIKNNVGFPFRYDHKLTCRPEEVKSGGFFNSEKIQPFPHKYAMKPCWVGISRRFGLKARWGKPFIYFRFQKMATGIRIETTQNVEIFKRW